MISYYLAWIVLLMTGLGVSLSLFVWAFRKGQFREQGRARYIPLRDEAGAFVPGTEKGARSESCIAVAILVIGLSGLIAVVVTLILRTPGTVR
ncbi:MAG TPA: hypothetical protein VHO84_13410 [Syntrophorhabdaceae bacterium]|nr:hypothetical protein [Syntrophorhabdaceae bacterium]